jgi:hypothetical protein
MKKGTTPIAINFRSFPRQNEDFSIQMTTDYGLQVGEAIQYEWFSKQANSCRFMDNRTEFNKRRLYANGMQGTSKYKERFVTDGDMSFLNLDWNIIPVIPKFRDIVSNGMSQREFTIKTFSIDPISTENRIKYRNEMEKDMVAKDFLMQAKEVLGVDGFTNDPETLPENEQELDLHLQLDYKPSIEISEELAIQSVFEDNYFIKTTKRRFENDLVDLGIGAVKHRYVEGDNVVLDYVDPANLIWSYTEDPYFKDCFYFGEYKNTNLSEIYKEYPNLTPDQKEVLEGVSSSWNNYYELNQFNNDIDTLDGKIGILYFNYRTSREKVWKKKNNVRGGVKVISKEKDFVYKGKGDANFEKLTKVEEVWFEGVLVLGTSILLEWKVCENMVKKDSDLSRAKPNYVVCAPKMYKGYIDSLVNRMIPFADDIQMSWLKLQQIKQRVVPDGQYIDVDGLAGINLGNGQAYTIEDALKMYFETGTVIGRSSTVGGEFNHGKVPITEIRHSSGQDKIKALWDSIQISMDMIASVTGINQAVDASNPDKNSLVGIQKMAAYSSNVATRHILDACVFMLTSIAECVSIRIADILKFSKGKENFARKIGRTSVFNLDEIKNLHLHDFSIYIELDPDDEEKAKLEADISLEIQQGNLGVEDKYAIMNIKNLKLAHQFLALRKKKRMKERQEQEMAKIEAQTQSNIQSAQAASESKSMLIQTEKNMDLEIEKAKGENAINKLNEEAKLKKELMELEFNYNMQLKGIEVDGMKKKEEMKEDRKDNRVSKQATLQSEIADQKANGKPPINFESREDSLDGGFNLGVFNPR